MRQGQRKVCQRWGGKDKVRDREKIRPYMGERQVQRRVKDQRLGNKKGRDRKNAGEGGKTRAKAGGKTRPETGKTGPETAEYGQREIKARGGKTKTQRESGLLVIETKIILIKKSQIDE